MVKNQTHHYGIAAAKVITLHGTRNEIIELTLLLTA